MAVSPSVFLGGRLRAAVARCGFATRGAAGSGPVGREPDPDSDWEPEERELQEVESALKRQKKAIRFQKIRRQMEAPGAPPRTLTREAMEQIRYLHKEFAESWSVPRLAEGFDVSTDVIRRVLKSKFVPTLEQKLKQDQKVLNKAGIAHSLQQIQASGDSTKLFPAGHSIPGLLLLPEGKTASKGCSASTTLKVLELNTHRTNTPRRQKRRDGGIQSLKGVKESFASRDAGLGPQSELQNHPTSDHDSGLPNDEKLEELKTREPKDQNLGSKVVQRGQDFFDSNGNFLYRI